MTVVEKSISELSTPYSLAVRDVTELILRFAEQFTRLALPADYSNDKLRSWNQKAVWLVKDLSGEGNDGWIYGATSVDTEKGRALSFDGVDDYVDVPITLPDEGTIALWYYPASPWYNYNTIFDNSINPDDWEMWIYDSGLLRARIEIDAYCSYQLPSPERWYHIVFTWIRDGTSVSCKLYVNGEEVDADTGTWVDPGAHFYLGGGNPGNTKGKGITDEVRIYNRALSEKEIQTLYSGGEVTDGLVLYYDFSRFSIDQHNPRLPGTDYGLCRMLINSGDQVYLGEGYPATETAIQPYFTVDKTNHKLTIENIYLDNDKEEINPTEIYDDDETFWSAYQAGTGSYAITLGEETTEVKKGTSSLSMAVGSGSYADVGCEHDYATLQDWSGKEFLCLWIYGNNTGLTINVDVIDGTTDADWGRWQIVDNFTGWRRFVLPLRDPDATGGASGTLDLSQIDILRIWFTPTSTFTMYLDRTLVDVGNDALLEIYPPDVLRTDIRSVRLYSYNPSLGDYDNAFLQFDPEDNNPAVSFDRSKLHFLDGTTLQDIDYNSASGTGYGLNGFLKGQRGETKSGVISGAEVTSITYSDYRGCIPRFGVYIRLPPDDGQDASDYGISQTKLKLELYYGQKLNYLDKSYVTDAGTAYVLNDVLHLTGTYKSRLAGGGLRIDRELQSGKISVKFKVTAWGADSDGVGVGFRGADANNEYVVLFRKDCWIELKIVKDGTEYTPFIKQHSIALDTQYTLEIEETSPDVYAVKLDGSTLFTFDMRSAPIASGYYSLYASGNTQAEFDDLVITASGSTVYNDDFTRPWGLATYEFEDSTNQYYGLQNVNDDWLAIFNPSTNQALILYAKMSGAGETPSALTVMADENEVIREVRVTFPSQRSGVFLGACPWSDLSLDGDGDGVPDWFENYVPQIADLASLDSEWG